MSKVIKLTELLKEAEPAAGSSKFPGKFHLGGGYYSSKEGGDAEFKSEDGKLRPLTPDEKVARKAGTQPKAEPKPSAEKPTAQKPATAQPKAKATTPAPAAKPAPTAEPAKPATTKPKPVEEPAPTPTSPEDRKADAEYQSEKKGLSHDEKKAYEFLDGMKPEEKAEAIEKALNDRTVWQKFSQDTILGGFLKKKGKQFAEFGKGIASLVRHRKTGVTEDCSGAPAGPHAKKQESIMEAPQDRQAYLGSLGKGGAPKQAAPVDKSKCKKVHYTDYMKRDENGEPMYEEVETPVYKKGKQPDPGSFGGDFHFLKGGGGFGVEDLDPDTGYFKKDDKYYDATGAEVDKKGNLLGKDGKPQQKKNLFGKPKTAKTKVPVYEDNLTPEQKHAAHESHHASHEQKHAIKHTCIEVGVIAASVAAPMFLASHAASAGAVAGEKAAEHGLSVIAHHVLKDVGKHAAAEMLGAPDAFTAGGLGAAASIATGGVLETRIRKQFLMMLEAGESPNANSAFMEKLVKQTLEKMKTFNMTPEQKLDSIRAYKEEKAESGEDKKEANPIKESVLTRTRIKEIANFVEYASKRLKLMERPKIKLVKEAEYLETEIIKDGSSALGGYIPAEKTIMVVNDGRLIADVLRTIAHEMVHCKQEELGKLGDLEEAGKSGSKFENQANSIAGILLREYGKMNKQIYKESKMFFSETEQLSVAIKEELNRIKNR